MRADKKLRLGWKIFVYVVASLFIFLIGVKFANTNYYNEGWFDGTETCKEIYNNSISNAVITTAFEDVDRCINYFCNQDYYDCEEDFSVDYLFQYCGEILTTDIYKNYTRSYLKYPEGW